MEARRVLGAQVPFRPNLFLLPFPFSTFPRNLTFSSTKAAKEFHLRVSSTDHEGDGRPFLELPPSKWGDHFRSFSPDISEVDVLAREIEAHKSKVRDLLMSSHNDAKKKICLIDLLINLGLSYHFENEIEEILKHAFEKINDLLADEDDLFTISIMFWVFRRYRHNMSSDVFKRFKGCDDKFKNCLTKDFKGMLKLYEAAHFGTMGEDILDEAISFASNHLVSLVGQASPHISRRIQNALLLPQHHNAPILFTREFLFFYEQEQDHNKMLLNFAKLNFKSLQLYYNRELKTLTKWWTDLDLRSKLPHYFRDRLVEGYFFAMIYFEPQFSHGRIMLAKFFTAMCIVDDTSDRYGYVPEIESLVDCVNRWDHKSVDTLPDYLKVVARFVFDVFEESERLVRSEGRLYSVQSAIEELKRVMRAQLTLLKWARGIEKEPSFEEYMEVGQVEITLDMTLACAFLGMGQIAGKEAYEWLQSRPKLTHALSMKGRLMNDMTGFKDDMYRGYAATGINIYMKQYGVTEEEAIGEFGKMVRDINKIMNEEYLKTSTIPRQILLLAMYCGNMIDVTYRFGEGYTQPEGKLKECITSLFVDPIHP